MIGQKKLLEILDGYTLDTLPKTLLFFSPDQSESQSLVQYLSIKFNMDTVIIDKEVDISDLIEYQTCSVKKFYTIDLNEFTDKNQNKLLKFIEEPASNVYILLFAKSETGILPTILNRCYKYHFENYTKDELYNILSNITDVNKLDQDIFEICKTPAQLKALDIGLFSEAKSLCTDLLQNITHYSYHSFLSTFAYINVKEDYNKLDFELFINLMEYLAFTDYKNNKTESSFKVYLATNKYKAILAQINPIKETFIINYLDYIWSEVH